MNCALTDYIKTAKLEHAKFLLETTDKSIQEIADILHLCSRTYLSDHFRRAYGLSPSAYRESRSAAN